MVRGKGTGVTPRRVKELVTEAVARESQYAIAKKTGLSLSVVQRLLKGDREPSTGTLLKLAEYFEVSVPELRGEGVVLSGEFEILSEEQKILLIRIAHALSDSENGQKYYYCFKTIIETEAPDKLTKLCDVLPKLL